jgi:hypothetical protein
MSFLAIADWHICISGCRQHEGQLTGLHRVWRALGSLRTPECCVLLREWDSDWKGLAELIWLTRPVAWSKSSRPHVNIYAYSWGVGHGFVRLAKALGRRGITVDNAVLCDPVYHSRLVSMRWLAFTGWPAITLPPNVLNVYGTYQRKDSPCGHPLKIEPGSMTVIRENRRLSCGHRWADESMFFHSQVEKVAKVQV